MNKRQLTLKLFAVISTLLVISACNNTAKKAEPAINTSDEAPAITKAVCVLYPTEGNKVSGLVTFTKRDSGIYVVADLNGLTPGKHGFHVHEYGDVSSPDGTSTGGHFNPDNMEHGGPDSAIRHVGDLGNLLADNDGKAHYERLDKFITFKGKHDIIGRAIIVHAGEDDFVTQPTGNAGARVASGVIGIAK